MYSLGYAVNLDELKTEASQTQRPKIRPKRVVKAKTTSEKERVAAVTRRVIEQHHAVLLKLKDR